MLLYMYNNGFGCNRDWTRAEFWLKKSSDQGNNDAKVELAIGYLTYGDIKKHANSRSSKKLYKKALEILEEASNDGEPMALEAYVKTAEMLYSPVYNGVSESIKDILKREHAIKAMAFCEKLSELATDSYVKQEWLQRRDNLKKRRTRDGERVRKARGGGRKFDPHNIGCGTFLIVMIVVGVILALIVNWIYKKDGGSPPNVNISAPSAVDVYEARFGMDDLDLLNMPESRVTELHQNTIPYDFSVNDQFSSKAILFRAGNGDPTAYADYKVDGKFEKLTFVMIDLLSATDKEIIEKLKGGLFAVCYIVTKQIFPEGQYVIYLKQTSSQHFSVFCEIDHLKSGYVGPYCFSQE